MYRTYRTPPGTGMKDMPHTLVPYEVSTEVTKLTELVRYVIKNREIAPK